MAKLYFLPLYEEVYKPYSKHNNDIAKYKKTPFEKITIPVFSNGARIQLDKYQKAGDYQEYGDSRWFREPYTASKYNYNVVSITIDGNTTYIKNMVTCFDLALGNHHIKITMNAYKYNPNEHSTKKYKKEQFTSDSQQLDLYMENGDYYLVATHKVQNGAYTYIDHYNSSASCISGYYFEYHSQEANIVSKSEFFSKLDGNIDFKNIDVSSLKESPAFRTIADVSASIVPKLEAQISVSKKETAPVYSTQKTLSNDEYFDMMVGAVSTKKTTQIASPTKSKEPSSIKPLTFITDSDPKYAELYEDGTLAYNTQEIVYVPRSVNKLNPYFIKGDKKVKKLVLPDGIEEIANEEFKESALEELVLPKTLKLFKKSAIYGCTNLKSVKFEDGNPYFTTIDDVVYERKGGTLELFWYPPTKTDVSFTPHSNCTSIGYQSVCNQHLYYLDLKGVTLVDMGAFQGSKKIREVIFSKDIKDIKSFAFDGTDLEEVSLPISTKVGSFAFPDGCKVKKKLLFK